MHYFLYTLYIYIHAYDEGERNIQEFKKLTLNGLRNVGMLKNCWNVLSKRTDDWAEKRMIIEDQLSVQRNWNLHPNNPNPHMTGLKDTYKSREESNLGKTGQIRMKINMVNNPVQNAPVFYHATNLTLNRAVTLTAECEDTLNHLGNCYICNKPEHLKRYCTEKTSTQAQAYSRSNRGQRKEVICFNCDKSGHFARQCRGPKKNYKQGSPQHSEKIMKMLQDMLVKCNSQSEDFQ